MRILHAVEFYAPSRGGAQEVVRRVSERMAEQGHHVTVATSALPERTTYSMNGVRIEEFDISGNAVRGMRGDTYDYQRYLIERPFDVIMTYAAQQWTTDLLLEVSEEIKAPVVCAPCGYSGLRDPDYRHYFETLPAKLRRLAGTVYHSDSYQDIQFARAHGLPNLHVIPNGAAASEFESFDDRGAVNLRQHYNVKGRLILTVGSHTGMKGHRQTIAAFAIAPIGPATLIVNGDARPGAGCTSSCRRLVRALRRFLDAQGKRVLLLDLPREDLVAAYHAADAFMLLSGCECSPVVLHEAAASATPFISTDVGNAQEIASSTEAGVILPRQARPIRSAARELTRLLREDDRHRAMAAAGRKAWLESFTWEQIADSYLALYGSLVGQGSRTAAL